MRVSETPDARLLANFVGSSPAFQRAITLIQRFARAKAPLLITGETGTGKEFAAHAAHYLSDRGTAAFVPVNCAALPDALIESELFGHAKGAFTDARRARPGLIREAEGGTLFLDEVEALSPRGQGILLRFLQDASFRSVGEEQHRHANVRVVTACNVNLQTLADRGEFRPDLLFRLDVLSIELPALRDRLDDMPLLARHLLAKAARQECSDVKGLSPAALDLLCMHSWPGNVRELEHVLLRAHVLCTGSVIDTQDLQRSSSALAGNHSASPRIDRAWLREEKTRAVREVERRFVEQALSMANGSISEAARLCDMERAALSKMAKKYRHDGSCSRMTLPHDLAPHRSDSDIRVDMPWATSAGRRDGFAQGRQEFVDGRDIALLKE
jgi:two-component system response regulator GlrR